MSPERDRVEDGSMKERRWYIFFIEENKQKQNQTEATIHLDTSLFKLTVEPEVVSHPDGELAKTEINHLFVVQFEDLKIVGEDVEKPHSN